MPHVVDKYRPVQPSVRSTHSPWGVLGALWAVGVGVWLWSAPDVHASLQAKESPLTPVASVAVSVGGALRLPVLREGLEQVATTSAAWPRFAERPPPPPPPEPEPVRAVGPDEPVSWRGLEPPAQRVIVVGASTINSYLGSELRRRLEEEYGVYAVRDGRLGTGLVRDDVFDWPAHLKSLVAEHKPDLVIANFGGNDAQPIQTAEGKIAFGKDGWDEAYAARVAGMVADTEAAGAQVVWIGMGVVKEPSFSERLRRLDRILEATVTEAGGVYVEQADLTAEADGAYKVDVTFDGQSGLMHMSDGVHLSRLGAKSVVDALVPRLERAASLLPAEEGLAVASRLDLDSAIRKEPAPTLLVVPREVPAGGLPLVYLLHGAWDGWDIWSEKAHRDLQRLATKHGLILAMPDGRPFGWYLDSPREPTNQMVRWFVEEERPAVEAAVPDNGRIGLLGISMGGHGAMNLALDDPEAYGAVSVLSGAVDLTFAESRKQLQALLGPLPENREAWESRSALHRVRAHEGPLPPVSLVCGTDDIWYPSNQALAEVLGDRAETRWVEGEGHAWSLWLSELDRQLAWQAEVLRRP
ncbi:MAG: DUF459 domain-containing protein [Deltaproteobacteria bacterium]|nr:MAG: DUF459 domain-containing protein [Deltaproteobacteria bacterium]